MRQVTGLFVLLIFAIHGSAAENIADAFTEGEVSLDFRYRFEFVDQDTIPNDAKASTLQSRLTYGTGSWYDLSAVATINNVSTIGADQYNSTRNGKTMYPTVADPTGTDIDQSYLQYDGVTDTQLRYGRQRISLNDQRFIGPVGFRQNPQTFGAVRADYDGLSDTALFYAYVNEVYRIFGPDSGSPADTFDSSSNLFNAAYTGFDDVTLWVFGYFLDLQSAPTQSSQTIGVLIEGMRKQSDALSFNYLFSYAHQQDYKSNPNNYSEDYWHAAVGMKASDYSIGLDYESLGGQQGDPTQSMQTPLATLHKFQGWADIFLTNPAGGIVDFNINGSVALGKYKLSVIYHDFQQQDGSLDYGDEWDASIGRSFADRYKVELALARYRADDFGTDTDKVWLTLQAGF